MKIISKSEKHTLQIVVDIYRYGTDEEKQMLNNLLELYEKNISKQQ